MLSRDLTRVGIIGLVDETTGYQKERAADVLTNILEQFIAKKITTMSAYIPTRIL